MDRNALRSLPKVELHRHLDGSVRPATMLEIARSHNLDLEAANLAELREKVTITTPLAGLPEVLERFAAVQKVLCSYEAIRRVARENVEDAHRDGVVLLELRFAPAFMAAGKLLENDEIIEAVLDGVSEGMEQYPVQVGLIGILPRTFAIEANQRATRDLIRYARSGHRGADRICGFDLAAEELGVDMEPLVPLVEQARQAGLGITVHSGENTDASCVLASLRLFGPQRLGHGIRIWGNRRAQEEVRRREVMLELCPTSNLLTRSVATLEEHPLPGLHRSGIPVSINSDDPQLFGIDLVHEYEICSRVFRMEAGELLAINRAAARWSFLPEELKRYVLSRHLRN